MQNEEAALHCFFNMISISYKIQWKKMHCPIPNHLLTHTHTCFSPFPTTQLEFCFCQLNFWVFHGLEERQWKERHSVNIKLRRKGSEKGKGHPWPDLSSQSTVANLGISWNGKKGREKRGWQSELQAKWG